jgi:tetratricopeptide (TPR) repeat protein
LVACAWHWIERGAIDGAYLANQAFVPLNRLGNFAEAEQLLRRALAIDSRRLGPHHPSVAISLNNLAQLLQTTNRLVEAEPLYRRALAINEQSLGPDHPDVARDLNNLAQLLQATDRL